PRDRRPQSPPAPPPAASRLDGRSSLRPSRCPFLQRVGFKQSRDPLLGQRDKLKLSWTRLGCCDEQPVRLECAKSTTCVLLAHRLPVPSVTKLGLQRARPSARADRPVKPSSP